MLCVCVCNALDLFLYNNCYCYYYCCQNIVDTSYIFIVSFDKWVLFFSQVWRSRGQYVKDDEEDLWKSVSLHDMSDEEDGDDVIKRKTPKTRPPEISVLIAKLDERHVETMRKSDRRILKVVRVQSDSPRKEF